MRAASTAAWPDADEHSFIRGSPEASSRPCVQTRQRQAFASPACAQQHCDAAPPSSLVPDEMAQRGCGHGDRDGGGERDLTLFGDHARREQQGRSRDRRSELPDQADYEKDGIAVLEDESTHATESMRAVPERFRALRRKAS